MNFINDHGDNTRGSNNSTAYVTKGQVKQFSKIGTGTPSAEYSFINMFPTDLSEITLDWGDNDTIEEYTVTFAYDYWTRIKSPMTGGSGTIADAIVQGTASSA